MKRIVVILTLIIWGFGFTYAREHSVLVSCGDNYIVLDWSSGMLQWSAYHGDMEVVAPSHISMTTSRGTWGIDVKAAEIEYRSVDRVLNSRLMSMAEIEECYNAAIVVFGEFAVELRAYDSGVAYRFISMAEGRYVVVDEVAEFAFAEEDMAWLPYVNFKPDATSDYDTQYYTSFENVYCHAALRDIDWRRLMFTPAVVCRDGLRCCIMESDVEAYPGMFLSNRNQDGVLDTEFAPMPDIVEQGDYNMLQGVVKSRKEYIAECDGVRTFPWRIVAISEEEAELVENNLVWLLASECRIEDTSWIKPGKVAWEWWNDWGLEGIDFKPGINTATYKYYIDFASHYGVEYVILDEGWAVTGEADLMQVVPEIDLEEIVAYADERGVGIILWAGYWALQRDIEGLCKHFAEMGVKGFKVDFLDRDDADMVHFVYELAGIAAKYRLLVDYHGVYKPTGLNRTYPNAISFEGVHGLETMKWLGGEHDQITYDVMIPFIRGVAGPMDYTPGAMRNAPRAEYRADYSHPMSQGTRCHQLAMYVVYISPLAMLCDSPTEYEKEPDYTRFIADIPTVWSYSECMEGEIGKYAVVKRMAEDGTFYLAGLNGNERRMIDITLPEGATDIEIYRDNIDEGGYIHECGTCDLSAICMEEGGGFVVKYRVDIAR